MDRGDVLMRYHTHSGADGASEAWAQYAFNLFSHNAPMTDTGYNEEEMKMVKETRKILGVSDIKITATCIRVRDPFPLGKPFALRHLRMLQKALCGQRQLPTPPPFPPAHICSHSLTDTHPCRHSHAIHTHYMPLPLYV